MIAAVRAFRCFVLKLQKVFYLQTSCQGYDWLQLTAALWKHRKALFESTHQHRDYWKNPRSSVPVWESVIIQHHPFKQRHRFYMTCILLVYFDGPRQSRKNWGLQNITIYRQVSHITMKWEKPLILLTAIIQLHKLHQSSWFKSADESLSSLANIAHVTLFKLHVAFASASHFATNLPSVPFCDSLSPDVFASQLEL